MFHANMTAILLFVAVFVFGGLSGLVSERAGVFNIGINGMMIIGAMMSAIIGYFLSPKLGNNSQFLAVFIAGLCGGGYAILHAFASITLKSNQIVSGMALSLLANGIGLFIVRLKSWNPGNQIESHYTNIFVNPGTNAVVPVFFIITIAVGIFIWFVLNWTKFGMRYISMGENPHAAAAAGLNVIKYRYIAVIFSGFLAGIAGAMFNAVTSWSFYGGVQGLGYVALAIMIAGQWRSLFVIIAAVIFSIFNGIGFVHDIKGVPTSVIQALPYIIGLGILVTLSKWSKMPKFDGQPFYKASR